MKPSLHGLRILNTRPQPQGKILTQQISEAGGIAIECPTLAIAESDEPWVDLLPELSQVQQAVFVSSNAVEYCCKQLMINQIIWPSTINVIAIGKETARRLNDYGITVNELPEAPDSEHVLALPSLQALNDQTVLLFKGIGGRPTIAEGLLSRGAKLIPLSVYKRVMPALDSDFINSLWQEDAVDIILVTSEQSIHNLFVLFSKEAHTWLQSKTCWVISERLAQVASLFKMNKIIISHPNEMLEKWFEYKD